MTLTAVLWLLGALALIYLLFKFVICPRPDGFDLRGKHVFITGGSKGIGKALALEAVARGANVTIVARDTASLQAAHRELDQACTINAQGSTTAYSDQHVQYFSLDVTKSFDEVISVVTRAAAQCGPVDVLINNAGNVGVQDAVHNIAAGHFEHAFRLNVISAQWLTQAVLPGMQKQKLVAIWMALSKNRSGRIVYVSSVAGQIGIWGYGAYSPTKFALRGLAETVQMEVAPDNVRCTVVYPPNTDTEGFQDELKAMPPVTRSISSSGGLMQPKEVARTVLDAVMLGQFTCAFGFDGNLISFAQADAPVDCNVGRLLLGILLASPCRLAMAILQRYFAFVTSGERAKQKTE